MASGMVTGWQHQLIDMEDFNKETFIEFCDKYYYHLHYFEITKEELDKRKQSRIIDAERDLEKAKAELIEIQKRTDDEWQSKYNIYVTTTEDSNRKYKASYEKEIARFRLIEEYANQIRPHLEYIWKELKEPKLYQSDILPFDDWKAGKFEYGECMIEFYQKKINDINSEEATENDKKAEAYEAAKKKFLEG